MRMGAHVLRPELHHLLLRERIERRLDLLGLLGVEDHQVVVQIGEVECQSDAAQGRQLVGLLEESPRLDLLRSPFFRLLK